MSAQDHQFQFTAAQIADAAQAEAKYHRERESYWRKEHDKAVTIVEKTIGAKVKRQPITGGYTVDIVIDYGDPAAYSQMQRSFQKAEKHAVEAEVYESDASVYGSQDGRMYELDRKDVQHYRLGGEPRKEDD